MQFQIEKQPSLLSAPLSYKKQTTRDDMGDQKMQAVDSNGKGRSNSRRKMMHNSVRGKPKPTFKSVGLYVKIGRRLSKPRNGEKIARHEKDERHVISFEGILNKHEEISKKMLTGEKEKLKIQPIPKMSNEMRRILFDLNKIHLIDSECTINEEGQEHLDSDDGEDEDIEVIELKDKNNKCVGSKPWHFIRHNILPQQRVLNTLKTQTVLKDKKLWAKTRTAEEKGVGQNDVLKLIQQKKLPRVTKKTEELLLRNSCFNKKLQTMKLCHATGQAFNQSFVYRRSSMSALVSTVIARGKLLNTNRRAYSCQSYLS